MDMKKIMLYLLVGLALVSISFASKIDYVYSKDCPYCQQVTPLINQLMSETVGLNGFNFVQVDTIYGQQLMKKHNTDGVPFVVIDDAQTLFGAKQIIDRLPCYAKQQSSINCPTYSADMSVADWFIWEAD